MNVTASFSRTPSGIVVEARSPAFVSRALAPMARVGRTPVVGVQCGGGVLSGLLLGTPEEGAELAVRFVPEPEIATGLRYRGRGGAPLLASHVAAPTRRMREAEAPEDVTVGRLLINYLPDRAPRAPEGRAFFRTIAGDREPRGPAWTRREAAMVGQLADGNFPDRTKRWEPIPVEVTRRGTTLRGTVYVMPDYLAIGSDRDYVYAPLDPVSAQQVADLLAATLPTARVCHAIWVHARSGRINRIPRDYARPDNARTTAPRGIDQASTAAYIEHSSAVRAKAAAIGASIGTLVAGHKKDVVVSPRLHASPNKIAFHGFYKSDGVPTEPCLEPGFSVPSCKTVPALAHVRRFSDYSQGVRLMRTVMEVAGRGTMSVEDVLGDKTLAWLLSAEGPIRPPRIPNVSRQQPRFPV